MTISAALLTGGESRRMGKDKATLIWNGRSLWQNQVEILRRLPARELLISARTDPAWRPADTVFVPDEPPSNGPISGIAAALRAITTTHLVVLAIDMPCMRSEYLRNLVSRVGTGSGLIPMIDGRAEPLAAVYGIGAGPYFDGALVGRDFSLRSVVQRLIGDGLLMEMPVHESEEFLFENLNRLPASDQTTASPNE
jgi:molybdenum cofactor guanylyltransferase